MRTGTLTIYSASAGSGKTFRLAGIYLHIFSDQRITTGRSRSYFYE